MEHPNDDRAEELLGVALALADDIRTDTAAAHRTVRYMDRADLEALACVLAACVPVDLPMSKLAWWRLHVVPRRPMDPELLKPCGTRAAYVRHREHGEEPCGPCKTANSEYFADRYQAKRQQRKGQAA